VLAEPDLTLALEPGCLERRRAAAVVALSGGPGPSYSQAIKNGAGTAVLYGGV
jgi:hypothetical protein